MKVVPQYEESVTPVEGVKLLGNFCYQIHRQYTLFTVLQVSKAPKTIGYWKKQRDHDRPRSRLGPLTTEDTSYTLDTAESWVMTYLFTSP